MNTKTAVILFSLCFLLAGCKEKTYSWMQCENSDRVIKVESIEMEKIVLSDIHTSFSGFSGIYDDHTLYFYDRYFGFLYLFNPDGSLNDRLLGLGRGPGEVIVPNAIGGAVDSFGNMCLIGTTMDFQTFNAKTGRTDYVRLDYVPDEKVDPGNFFNYSFSTGNMQVRYHEGEIYVNLQSQRPDYNHFDNQSDYVNTSYRIGVINPATKSSRMIVMGFPRIYQDDRAKYVSCDLVNYDVCKSYLLVNFEADSTIYKCTLNGKPEKSFGAAGRQMDLDYLETPGMNETSFSNYAVNRISKARYGTIVSIGDMVFRSYTRGAEAAEDGLQIYEKEILIGDIDVPKGFTVTGKIGGYYYSAVYADADAEELYLYRFKI